MSDNLACARATEALEWLAGYDPGDGLGAVGDDAASEAAGQFERHCVIDAFVAGADHADQAFAIERSTGQRQLDDAAALIREAADLFVGYAEHHRDRANRAAIPEQEAASLQKAGVNLLMAVRLKEWLAGGDAYSVSVAAACDHVDLTRDQPGLECGELRRTYTDRGDVWPLYDARCRMTEADKWRIQFREEGRQARRDGLTTADCPHFPKVPGGTDLFPGVNPGAEWMTGWHDEDSGCRGYENIVNFGSWGRDVPTKSNVRPVTDGPLAESGVVDALVGVLHLPAPLFTMACDTAFRIQTPDPRFDPRKPVMVNGYLFTPATEA